MRPLHDPEQETLVVAEVFGPTIQGEGRSAGRTAGFIRTMGCNLSCTWCDTPYTWDSERFNLRAQGQRRTAVDIASAALSGDPSMVVITGGEPLLHQEQPGWRPLLRALAMARKPVEIETNGTVQPTIITHSAAGVRFNVSPKLAHAGQKSWRESTGSLAWFAQYAHAGVVTFKFVWAGPDDWAEVDAMVAELSIPRSAVWMMPLGTEPGEITQGLQGLTPGAVERGYNVTSRLHVLAGAR